MIRDFINLFFPPTCFACNELLVKNEATVCTTCLHTFPKTNAHLIPSDNAIIRKFYGRVSLKYGFALYTLKKGSYLQQLMQQMKYKNRPEIAILLGKQYGELLVKIPLGTMFDMLLPVPLHQKREVERGYNQSALFAQGLANTLGIDWSEQHLKRIRPTATQTKKSRIERLYNMEGAFRVDDAELLLGKRILLVDDILTTGATLEACAQALLNVGIKDVSIATIAVAA